MTTMVIVTLMVIFGALLVGKMLMDMFPNSGFGRKPSEGADDQTPAE
ncbi:hypothetical protein [Roseovarius indicus]|uniref:Uncharacterized protein n=1 Tax=Roseovarius indicus TaxID=540747 RepID=A0A5P3A6S8_9RHOB|nr:hypothetical protein [Roseovarius indicus]QEW24771.1 hypothetical protein RIdsm_00554 [Roseovarius indicus]SFE51862.1 hypothetical protein SAMN04488031_111132 [Roseovarius indicus]